MESSKVQYLGEKEVSQLIGRSISALRNDRWKGQSHHALFVKQKELKR